MRAIILLLLLLKLYLLKLIILLKEVFLDKFYEIIL